ncbi:MAG: helix-turn-helix transcriptional regulator [Candidatus Limnocylindrus sp.]
MTGRNSAEESPIPNRIAELRARAKLSRVELAERVGVNPQTIGYLERGEYNPSLALAFRFAEIFGLPVEKIFLRAMSEKKARR